MRMLWIILSASRYTRCAPDNAAFCGRGATPLHSGFGSLCRIMNTYIIMHMIEFFACRVTSSELCALCRAGAHAGELRRDVRFSPAPASVCLPFPLHHQSGPARRLREWGEGGCGRVVGGGMGAGRGGEQGAGNDGTELYAEHIAATVGRTVLVLLEARWNYR